jgi:peptidoglycan/xylan/chitin deacetylase (PgdA/CDA1 family)
MMIQTKDRIQQAYEIPILAFHKIDFRWEWGVTRVTPRQFASVVHYLKGHGYTTITLEQALNPLFQLPQKPVILTFDDAYQSIYDYAFPILEEAGYTATIFVITDFIGQKNTWDVNLGWLYFQHLSWDAILELSRAGFEFGSHTHRHPDLTRIGRKRILSELVTSKKIIEDRLGLSVPVISYPFGRYNREVLRLSREAGYCAGCAFWNRYPGEEQFVFERKAYYLFDGLWNLNAKLGHNLLTRFEMAKLRVINFCSHGTSWVKPSK